MAESILERNISGVENYAYLRTSDNEFLVSRSVMVKFDTGINVQIMELVKQIIKSVPQLINPVIALHV